MGSRRRVALLVGVLAVLAAGCVSLTSYEEVRRGLPEGDLLDIDGQWVHVVDRGSGEAIVLLHGFGGSAYSWRLVAPRLVTPAGGDPPPAAAGGYRTLAVDLNGFGYTERPRDPAAYTVPGQIALVLGVLDRLGIERAHLVGHSYGGAVALHLARRHPERLLSLTVVNSAGPEYPRYRRAWPARLRPLVTAFVRTIGLRRGRIERGLERSIRDDRLVTPRLVDAYHERVRVEGVARAYYGLTVPQPGLEVEWFDVAEIVLPTLVVWGADDTLIPASDGEAASRRVPDARFVLLEDTGHLPLEERPAELARHLLEFLAGLPGPGRDPAPGLAPAEDGAG